MRYNSIKYWVRIIFCISLVFLVSSIFDNLSFLAEYLTNSSYRFKFFNDDFSGVKLNTLRWLLENGALSCNKGICFGAVSMRTGEEFKYKTLQFRMKLEPFSDNLIFGFFNFGTDPYAVFWGRQELLYTRTYNGSIVQENIVQNVNLSDFNIYKIRWDKTNVTYFINNQLLASYPSPTFEPRTIVIYSNPNNITIDWVKYA